MKTLLIVINCFVLAPTLAAQDKLDDKLDAKPDRTRVKPDMYEGVREEPHMIFTYVDEKKRRRLTLDLYRPAEGKGPYPVIVMYFGGGWQNGRPGIFAAVAQALAQRGYVCVVPQYRLSGEKPFPAAVYDCKAAVRWTRKNAKRFKMDPNRIACLGGSAGGHLSGFMAASNGIARFEGKGEYREFSSDVQAAIVMCGPMNLLSPQIIERVEKAAAKPEGDAIIDFMGGALPSQKTGIYREASPLTHVSERTPPMLFIDGEYDRPRVRYTEFWAKLDQHKIPNEFVLMPKAPHPFWNMRQWFLPTVSAVDQFLQKQLK
jgi:pectinesterase